MNCAYRFEIISISVSDLCTERLRTAQARADELEKLICRIYEDHILDKIPDTRYEALDNQYSAELDSLKNEIDFCEKAIARVSNTTSPSKFVEMIESMDSFDHLTPTMTNMLIEKIIIHEREIKGAQNSPQQIDIYFNFIGHFLPESMNQEPSEEELAAWNAELARQKRRHEDYLRQKESGKQKKYEEGYQPRRKQKLDAAKAEIRVEDVANGIFIPKQPILNPRRGITP